MKIIGYEQTENKIGNHGAEALGEALKVNTTLTKLVLSGQR